MSSDTSFYRFLALGSHIALLVWVIVWHFFLTAQSDYSSLFIFVMYVLPLLLPLPGIVRGKPYTHAWANFVILLYIIHGITVAYAVPVERGFALVELVLASLMFCGCSVYARKRGRELGTGLKKLKTVMQEERERFEKR
ncbi:DUF2069 domain-containing protein [Alteromonas halophila]|uniref:Membrane protein n=1 Tax=Alteromonas halophila TaxID=516698 RepID=A0A918JPW7_9ALTE|nr:DUF2069 domain-containing protein [Alteromonas halophila]GGW95883.1 membrane protein [Alteromonas halophila]